MKKNKLIQFIVLIVLTLTIPLSIYLISQKSFFINKAYTPLFGVKAQLTVNLTDSYPQESYSWANLAQGGEESNGMLGPVADKITNLEPEYIRIDHVFDFYDVVKRDGDGKLYFEWTKLDSELNVVSATGAKPFISISYMPPVLTGASEVDIPNNWREYSDVVRALVEHISGEGGLAIENVYYEVWNEPDLFGDFKLMGSKNYLTLYQYAQNGAVSAKGVLPFKFGGPAITNLDKTWFDGFMRFVQQNKYRLDFFSWHRYSKNIEQYDTDIINAKDWIVSYPEYKNIELIISEAGYDSDVDSDYDTSFSAIHTIAMYASTFRKIDKIFSFEIKDGPGPEKNWGRWGLLTHEKFGEPEEKPRYKAIEFLNLLKGQYHVIYGQGTWVKAVATEDNGRVKLLMVNYDPYDRHYESVPITFINLKSNKFLLRRSDFMGSVSEYLVNVDDTTSWQTKQLLKPNQATILEIIPQ